jgi:hypothetical protein
VAYNIAYGHFPAIISILSLDLLSLQINLENIFVSIENKEVSLAAHIKAFLVDYIRGLEAIVLSDFPKQH